MSEKGAIQSAVEEYFDRRGVRPQRSWDTWLPQEHAFAFTVARSAGFDILKDIRAAVRTAVLEGVPFDVFRNELTPKLQAAGWWGQRKRVDDRSGAVVTEQLGSPRRLKIIYEANIRSAQAAGEWADAWSNRDTTPYLEYMTSVSERKRPEHLAWVGTTLPIDDPWWRTHYPPNGWNCKCRARPRSDDSRATPAQRRAPPIDLQPWRAKGTGESRLVPKGIDPGWEHNPGLQRQRLAGQAFTQRLDRMVDADARREAVARLRRDPAFNYLFETGNGFDYKRRLAPELADIGRQRWPVAVISPELRDALQSDSDVVTVSVADAAKINAVHTEVARADWDALQTILDNPSFTRVEDNGKLAIWYRTANGTPMKIIIKRSQDGELFLNSWYRPREKAYKRAEG